MGAQYAKERLDFIEVLPTRVEETFADIVSHGLSLPQKQIPSRFFYDDRGSELFEQITQLQEYYLTRAEQSILEACAKDILGSVPQPFSIIEFGSGSSYKTRLLIEAAIAQQQALHYVPIDISAEFLRESVESLLATYKPLSVTALAAEYFDGLRSLPHPGGPRLFLFLGSNIGNFNEKEAISFLNAIREQLRPVDRLLTGVDLNQDPRSIEPAYNDSAGVTQAFNKNLLARINSELGGQFELDNFEHQAPYLSEPARIEMRLVSRTDQIVPITALGKSFAFRTGEYIHTENSYKYSIESFESLARASGLQIEEAWTDLSRRFGLFMLKAEA